jgi:hypothetical protein
MLPLLRREACLTLALVLAACGSEPRIPTTITPTPSAVVLTSLGETQQLSTSVSDQNGNPLTEAAVSWSSTDGAVASVSPTGLVTAVGPGTAEVIATAGSANATVAVSVVQTPTQMSKVSGDAQTDTVAQPLPLPLTVELKDALGSPVAGATVTFAVTQGGGTVASPSVTTGADGRASSVFTLGTSAGANYQVSATSQVASVSAIFLETAVAAPPASVTLESGDGQSVPPGASVPTAPAVRVRDAFGNPVSGVSVTFQVGVGGGSVTGATQTTDATGVARVTSWTLGSAGANTLIATVAGDGITGNPVTFTATAAAGVAFDIKVRISGSPTSAQRHAFADAEARWENLITGDLPNVFLSAAAGDCGTNSPAINETIDDVVILASVDVIDGPGGILAQAGPCYVRVPSRLPILGLMSFDQADLASIEADGLLSTVILHEMGHVLGFGIIWSDPGIALLADPTFDGGTDPHFVGAQALAAFNSVGGAGYTESAKVPVENMGDPGTKDAHWRESVFGNELMTGFVNQGQNPLSKVTVASLGDLAYSINLAGADSYSLGSSIRALVSGTRLHLGNDIFLGPIRMVDPKGRVTGLLRR